MSWLVNPEDEDEAVLFNADAGSKYEENAGKKKKEAAKKKKPKKRKATKEKAKKKKPRKKKAGKRKRSVIKLIEAPKKPKKRKKGKKKAEAKIAALRKKLKEALAQKKKRKSYETNPRKRKHKSRSRRRKYASNAEAPNAGAPKKHKKAKKRRTWKARVWKTNPKLDTAIFKLPTWAAVKGKPFHAVGFGVLGAVDSGLIGLAVEYGVKKADQKEIVVDAARITGKLLGGSAISLGVNHFAKGNGKFYAQCHQFGVYFNTTLDTIGTAIKHIMRAVKQKEYRVTEGSLSGDWNMTPQRAAMSIFGVAPLYDVIQEQKLIEALKTDGLVVAADEGGNLAVANANTGDIIVSGPAEAMGKVIEGVNGIEIAADDESYEDDPTLLDGEEDMYYDYGDVDDDGESTLAAMGEDITVEV